MIGIAEEISGLDLKTTLSKLERMFKSLKYAYDRLTSVGCMLPTVVVLEIDGMRVLEGEITKPVEDLLERLPSSVAYCYAWLYIDDEKDFTDEAERDEFNKLMMLDIVPSRAVELYNTRRF